jgi:hypothetical protein
LFAVGELVLRTAETKFVGIGKQRVADAAEEFISFVETLHKIYKLLGL